MAGFWIVMAMLAGAIAGTWAVVEGARAPWAWGLAAAAVLLAPGLLWPPWFERGVWVWNGCTRRGATVLRSWVLTVCYFTVVALVGRAGSPMSTSTRGPRWTRLEIDPAREARDVLALCRWEHRWALALVPVLALLAVLSEDQSESAPPSSTYTLY
jgi:hypothetical protein